MFCFLVVGGGLRTKCRNRSFLFCETLIAVLNIAVGFRMCLESKKQCEMKWRKNTHFSTSTQISVYVYMSQDTILCIRVALRQQNYCPINKSTI